MQVDFRTVKLRRAYNEDDFAKRLWGTAIARKYIQRVDTLYAVASFDDLRKMQALRPHPLKGKKKGDWALDLSGYWRLEVAPSKDGTTVNVKEVSDHYGD